MSEKLEALEILKYLEFLSMSKYEFDWDILRKPIKAIEIIKEKRVDIVFFYKCKNLRDYNCTIALGTKPLTKEEYNLLKEVLL